ncbi:MAG: glycosyltransferase family 2 protein [Planctomycetes bacterium]|nr:glycosyltransferase family 2 protein [Planctomycetota bacterium]
MPAYNAEATLEKTLQDIPDGCTDEIILVDDCSKDRTAELARSLGITVIEHESNKGYGGNQKTCYLAALDHGADFVVMLHPDYQYDARLVPYLVGFLKAGICDVLLGSRIRTRHEALSRGMPAYKYFSNRFMTFFENLVLGQNLGEFHSGYRAYNRKVLETVPFLNNSDDFAFDSEFLIQSVYFGFRLGDVPVPVRYFDEASSIDLTRSMVYGISTMATLIKYLGTVTKIYKSKIFKPDRRGLVVDEASSK